MKKQIHHILAFLSIYAAPVIGSEPFLGWIPVQYVPPGGSLVLDMRRFWEPAPGEDLQLSNPKESGLQTSFDRAAMELRVDAPSTASGISDIPIQVVKDGKPTGRLGVLTLALEEPGIPATPAKPAVFAQRREGGSLFFQILSKSPVQRISVILQLADGTSRPLAFDESKGTVAVSTKDLPQDAWIRVVIADKDGQSSRVARARVSETKDFQWQDGVIYYAFTDRFANGEKANDRPVPGDKVLPPADYQGGDFEGVRQHIEDDYFQKLGVNVLWLAPLNRNPDGAWQEYLPPYRHYSGYHGYWPVSHTEVEPRFGGNVGLRALVESAHKDGIKVIADLVLKHVHVEHPLWTSKREWFGTLELPDGRKNLRLWDEQQFTTWFEEWLPGFDFDNPEAVAFLLDNAKFWINEFGLDGYRLDAVKHIRYSFWPSFRSTMRAMDSAGAPRYFVGETFMDRQGIMGFVGPNMLDGQFDFPLYDTIMEVFAKDVQGFAELEKSLSESETIYGKETLMSPLVGNHDKSRFMAFADGDLPKPGETDEEEIGWTQSIEVDHASSYEKLKMALAFILSLDGVPMIYYGDEVGLTGAGDPDNRRMMPLDEKLTPEQKSVKAHFSKLTDLRSRHPALRYGTRRPLLADGNRYAFVRRHFDDAVLCVWNKGSEAASYDLKVANEIPDGNYRNALNGELLRIRSGNASFSLPPRQVAFFVKAETTP